MADKTTIPWCDYTFNPVWGCTKVDRGCKHCYAENWANRWKFNVWGPTSPFREFDDRQWNKPLRWNNKVGTKLAVLERKDYPGRPRVFPSMCDPFDADWPQHIRDRLWTLIRKTPRLDWQFPFDHVRRCVGCGCHDFHACSGGCSWAGADVCSNCATAEGKL